MAYTKYSLTPSNNTATPPDGAPEGMLPSAVNDTMRDMMAQIRDVGDGIRDGTYTMTAAKITGGTITGVAFTGNTFTSPVISGGSINNTPIGATTASTGKFSDLTDTGLTSGRVIYATTGGNLTDDADFTFNGTTVTMANDASISGLTVGKGGGAVASNTTVNGLASNTSGTNNSAFGQYALNANTTGSQNTANGQGALFSSTTGGNNSAFGYQALLSNTTASNNTAVGYQAGYTGTTAAKCTYIGTQAGYSCSDTGDVHNTAIGFQAGYTMGVAYYNTFVGSTAGYSVTTGNNNTFVGYASGTSMTTGSKNTILGRYNGNQGGLDIRTASNYIVLSDGDGNPVGFFNANKAFKASGQDSPNSTSSAVHELLGKNGNSDYSVLISSVYNGSTVAGYPLHVNYLSMAPNDTTSRFITCTDINASRMFVYSNGNIVNANNSYGSLSDQALKENIVDATPKLDKICDVKVRNYNLIGETQKQIGVIAQELETVFPSMVEVDGESNMKQVKYSVFVPILIKAIQELKAEVDSLKAQLNK